jgi:(2Fe-2S) ferredoxin
MLVRQLAATDDEPTYSLAIMPKPKGRAALYSNLTGDDLVTIVREHMLGGRVVRRLLSVKPKSARTGADGKPGHQLPQVLTTVRGTSEGEP